MQLHTSITRHLLATAAALAATMILIPEAQAHLTLIRQGAESAQFPEPGDQFGSAVVAGDFNGDGHDDLATGSPGESGTGASQTGNVIISFGSTHGITHLGAQLHYTSDFGSSIESNQRFGASLASSDLNQDGYDDLIVGSPHQMIGSSPNAGRVYIYAGAAGGLTPWLTFEQEDLGGFSAPNDLFGWSLAVGRLDGDPYDDIAIGSPANGVREGTVFVIYGTDTGPFGSAEILTGEVLGATLDTQDYFGASLAIGNVYGNSIQDLIIGAPHRAAFGESSAGVVFVVPGNEASLSLGDNQRVTADYLDSVAVQADFGTSLATIPIGTYDQLAIGEPNRYIGSAKAGRVVLINGGLDGPVASSAYAITQETFGGTSEDFDTFGLTLSVGKFQTDNLVDLAIGVPNKDWLGDATGIVYVALGGVAGIGNSGNFVYSQSFLGETPESGDRFGSSLAFGAFDATDNGTLIVGVPGEDSSTGMVHVIAPWRQIVNPQFKTAFVRDCQGDIYYSHKPFEQVFIASTTKIMTVLLACEAAQLPPSDPRHVALLESYTVPDWVADDIPGSQANLEEGEITNLQELMFFSLLISGNDAAHAIGDLLFGSGGPNESIPLFLAKMNDRAAELGMFDTHFNNANGFEQEVVGPDFGDHYSTAYDMEILSRAAMQNPLFRAISNTVSRTIVRNKPSGAVAQTINSFQTWILNNNINVVGSGIKGGWTPAAQTTWCVSLEGSAGGRAIATTFGTASGNTASAQAIVLAAFGVSDCATWQPYSPPTFSYVHGGIFSSVDDTQIYSLNPTSPLSMQLNLFQANDDVESTNATLYVRRNSQMGIDPGEIVEFGITPYWAPEPVYITNMTDHVTTIFFGSPGHTRFYDIAAHDVLVIPALEGPSSGISWSIANADPLPAELAVTEGYRFEVNEPGSLGPGSPVFSAVLTRAPQTTNEDLLSFEIDWHESGSEYVLTVHSPDVTVSAPETDGLPGDTNTLVSLAPPAPNPFREQTQLRFALREPASVGVSIHDVTGRRIRHYPAVEHQAGTWNIDWNGTGDRGEPVAPGVYFYRLDVDGQAAGGGKLQRVR